MIYQTIKCHRWVELNRAKPIKDIFVSHPIWLEHYKATQSFINSRLCQHMVRPDVPATLKLLNTLGITQILLSDHSLKNKLKTLGLESYFNFSFSCFDHIGYWKPHSKIIEFLQKKTNLDLEKALAIGDREDTDQVLFRECKHFMFINA